MGSTMNALFGAEAKQKMRKGVQILDAPVARARTCRGANLRTLRTSFSVRTGAKRRARAPRIAFCAGRTRFAFKAEIFAAVASNCWMASVAW